MRSSMYLVPVAALAAALVSGCGATDATASSPTAAARSQGATEVPSTEPASLAPADERSDPGLRVLLSKSGSGSAVFPVPTGASQLKLAYACLGTGRIDIKLQGQGPESTCVDGQAMLVKLPGTTNGDAINVQAEPGARWNLVLQGR